MCINNNSSSNNDIVLSKNEVIAANAASEKSTNLKYYVTSGTVADTSKFSTLAKFKIPSDNEQITNMLLNKILQLKCENNEDSTTSRKLTLNNLLNPALLEVQGI